MAQKFAVFDIDGTIIRWQLYHAIVDRLAKSGQISSQAFQSARSARMNWKTRTNDAAFKDYERLLVSIFDEAITTISYDEYMLAVQAVFDEYKQQTYVYTRDLMRDLKQQGYLLFAISASQYQVVELLARYYGFDDWGGSEYLVKDGRFTGEKQVLLHDEKPQLLKKLVAKHAASYTGSIGVGDSESDIPMLSAVEKPIAFNPSRLLFDHAQAKKWQIVVERKNVIYKLEPSHGTYLLA